LLIHCSEWQTSQRLNPKMKPSILCRHKTRVIQKKVLFLG
jgi:hypothetical protein